MITKVQGLLSSSFLRRITLSKIAVGSIIIGSISLATIAFRLGPISNFSRSFNRCVNTTSTFLSTVPGFQSASKDGLEAMSVSLCNGSTPQRSNEEKSSTQ